MSEHLRSAESVVLPVPDRPKNRVTLLFLFIFAEQCIGNTSSSVNKKF